MSLSSPTAGRLTPAQLQNAARSLGTGGAGATQLLALLYDPEVDTQKLLGKLQGEPALAARVLKVANSPFYRLSGSVGTLDRAVALLGLSAIRGIAAAGCLDRVTPPAAGSAFNPDRFRRHSLAVATAAQQLSQAAGAGIDSEAFMAGLLHDIGILLLVKAAPHAMAAFKPIDAADPAAALADERLHLGATHEDGAIELAKAWQLPGWLGEAVASHHAPAVGAGATLKGLAALPLILALANQAAHLADLGFWPICGLAPEPDLHTRLGVSQAQWDGIVQALPATLDALSAAGAA